MIISFLIILVYFDGRILQVRELGFDGYAIDFIDCPPAMRGFLMRECQLHRTVRPQPSSREDH
jgi:hypothetical protein